MVDAGSLTLNALGAAAADFFLARLRDGDIVAITPGTSIQAVVQAIDTTRSYSKVEVAPMLGAIQGPIESDMNYLATDMGERLGARAYQLHAPAFVASREDCEVLRCMGPVKEILRLPVVRALPFGCGHGGCGNLAFCTVHSPIC
jgi:DNA-binding transcriptional regulator LsrR (DeoR family)